MHPASWDPFRTTNNGRESNSRNNDNNYNNSNNQVLENNISNNSGINSHIISSYRAHHSLDSTTLTPLIITPTNQHSIVPQYPAASPSARVLPTTTTTAIPRDILSQNSAPRPWTDFNPHSCRLGLPSFSMERQTSTDDEPANAVQETSVGQQHQQNEQEERGSDTTTAKASDTAHRAIVGNAPHGEENKESMGEESKKKRKRRPPAVPWKVGRT
jgi:hypothetical protein